MGCIFMRLSDLETYGIAFVSVCLIAMAMTLLTSASLVAQCLFYIASTMARSLPRQYTAQRNDFANTKFDGVPNDFQVSENKRRRRNG